GPPCIPIAMGNPARPLPRFRLLRHKTPAARDEHGHEWSSGLHPSSSAHRGHTIADPLARAIAWRCSSNRVDKSGDRSDATPNFHHARLNGSQSVTRFDLVRLLRL